MKNQYSQESFTELCEKEESKWLEEMGSLEETQGPKSITIKNILGYSKALKCTPSSRFGMIEQVMN